MVARARRAEGVAIKLREAELCLQVVRRQRCKRPAKAVPCAREKSEAKVSTSRPRPFPACKQTAIARVNSRAKTVGSERGGWLQQCRVNQQSALGCRPVTMTRTLAIWAVLRLLTRARTWGRGRWFRPLQCHDVKKPSCTRGASGILFPLPGSTWECGTSQACGSRARKRAPVAARQTTQCVTGVYLIGASPDDAAVSRHDTVTHVPAYLSRYWPS